MEVDRTPIRDAQHGPARFHRPDSDGHLRPVGSTIEAITGRCVEPPGRRTMTYVVLLVSAGATGSDHLVGIGQAIRLEYRVPASSTRQARIDYEMDALGWLGSDLAAVEGWLRDHELWDGPAGTGVPGRSLRADASRGASSPVLDQRLVRALAIYPLPP